MIKKKNLSEIKLVRSEKKLSHFFPFGKKIKYTPIRTLQIGNSFLEIFFFKVPHRRY